MNLPDRSMDVSRRAMLTGTLGAGALLTLGDRPSALGAVSGTGARSVAVPITSCATWGAKPPTEPVRLTSPLQQLIVHHTATPNSTDYSQKHAFAFARSVQQSHFARDWIDTGQHLTISRGGHVLEGRHRTLESLATRTQFPLGAHCTDMNPVAFGIENEGTYSEVLPPAALWKRLVETCAFVCSTYRVDPKIIVGHRDHQSTDCPGEQLYKKLPALRSSVRTSMAARPWGRVSPGDVSPNVRAAQLLLRQTGRSVPVDGGYDSAMTSVVKSYQGAKGMFFVDGIIGAVTWESGLTPTLRTGSTARDAVRAAQTMLTARGHRTTISGTFDDATSRAVKAFQSSRSLTADAVIGLDTWSRLLA